MMGKRKRVRHEPMKYLRAWRESLGLSRQAVADRLGSLRASSGPVDQGTIAKWESGETAIRVEDLLLLAKIYGANPEWLFFKPGDGVSLARLQTFFDVVKHKDPTAVEAWLTMGAMLAERSAPKTGEA